MLHLSIHSLFSVFYAKRLVHCPDYFGYSYRTSFNRSPHAGARKPALSRFFALRSSVINAISRFPSRPPQAFRSGSAPCGTENRFRYRNDKNPVFLAEINSGNRPYCRFFIRLLAQKLLKSYVPINAFDASFIFPHRAVLPENTRISARKHAFCHQSRYGIRMFCPPHSDGCGSAPASARGW